MFGYIVPCKMELKIKDYEKFKSYYCGLCHAIKANYGNYPRISLNYDMTFFALLLQGLQKDNIEYCKITCSLHPFQKKIIAKNIDSLNYAAHLNVILFYFKLLDDIKDDGSLKSRLYIAPLKYNKKLFSKEYTYTNNLLEEKLNVLFKLEKSSKILNIDEVCHPFADLTGLLARDYPKKFINDSFELREKLYWMFYYLGKWIYLIDALDDLKEDLELGRFNIVNKCFNEHNLSFMDFYPLIKERIEFLLLSCSSQCYNIFNDLPIVENRDLLANIIQLGMMEKFDIISQKYNDNFKRSE